MIKRTNVWILQGGGWLLVLYLVYAQAISAISYDLGVAMGTQESAQQITEIGAAFWYGFTFGDLVVYLPLLVFGLLGQAFALVWARVVLSAALGITVYWPVVCLAAVVSAREAPGWNLSKETDYWIVLPLITFWAAWCLWCVTVDARKTGVQS